MYAYNKTHLLRAYRAVSAHTNRHTSFEDTYREA